MRISNSEAELRAVELAEAFLAGQNTRGYAWKCVDARPDLVADDVREGKTFVKWAVVVEYSRNDTVVDGPAIVMVDIRTKECRFLQTDAT